MPSPPELTKSRINKLGDSLRKATTLEDDALDLLQQFRIQYDQPMQDAQRVLREGLGLEPTGRLKTVNTIVEKLRREKTRLAEMQDIAGLRIVRDMSLSEQTALVEAIRTVFDRSKAVDRRSKPSFGYRAVHVIAEVGGRLVEIQVRTVLQDLWAQAMERLADEIGREIRYGGTPKERPETVKALMSVALGIERLEAMLDLIHVTRQQLGVRPAAPAKQQKGDKMDAQLAKVEAQAKEIFSDLRDTLTSDTGSR